MAQQADITVFDGASTPVSHLLKTQDNKVDKQGNRVATWRENLLTLPEEASVTLTIFQRTHPSGVKETRTDVKVPVMESVSGQNSAGYTAAPKVAYVDRSVYIQYAHPRSTPTSRRICKQILINLMNNVSVTAPAISAGVVDEAAVNGFMPT